MSKGTKNDQGKARINLVPVEAIEGAAKAFGFGADKYGVDNFRNGIAYRRLADATMRHLLAYMNGEDNDPESGLSHLDHGLASLSMLKFMSVHKTELDDRWKTNMKKDKDK